MDYFLFMKGYKYMKCCMEIGTKDLNRFIMMNSEEEIYKEIRKKDLYENIIKYKNVMIEILGSDDYSSVLFNNDEKFNIFKKENNDKVIKLNNAFIKYIFPFLDYMSSSGFFSRCVYTHVTIFKSEDDMFLTKIFEINNTQRNTGMLGLFQPELSIYDLFFNKSYKCKSVRRLNTERIINNSIINCSNAYLSMFYSSFLNIDLNNIDCIAKNAIKRCYVNNFIISLDTSSIYRKFNSKIRLVSLSIPKIYLSIYSSNFLNDSLCEIFNNINKSECILLTNNNLVNFIMREDSCKIFSEWINEDRYDVISDLSNIFIFDYKKLKENMILERKIVDPRFQSVEIKKFLELFERNENTNERRNKEVNNNGT